MVEYKINYRTFGFFRKMIVSILGEKFYVKGEDIELIGYFYKGNYYIVKERYYDKIVTEN